MPRCMKWHGSSPRELPYVTLKVSFIELDCKIPEDVAQYLNRP
ncbi:hypothetical protein HMPREF9374_3262 [Desmospora sp. 8437]|nr:hypothetical protein HMPREF9374_3262 [Desmospora sp. 8437]